MRFTKKRCQNILWHNGPTAVEIWLCCVAGESVVLQHACHSYNLLYIYMLLLYNDFSCWKKVFTLYPILFDIVVQNKPVQISS